ncbi:hypothetical protein AWQ21_14630 (plasmid) [Picosynechococcus sp. PCC 7003]|uniref:hypothetical protein n=1 Tax=Picosynechococcus sp. PCC 7003 TaxID=374981 RepID=UPI0008108211|nr:hypothetical protein [Picosynechococcus sp. PCC 7003]ANV85767.1 hypothetical protein AWQ21_14630 [Picosynechococcus sp. PCC 7003]
MADLSRLRELTEKYSYRWGDLKKWIDRIEFSYESDIESAISNSNSLIETIFKTILSELDEEYRNDPSKLRSIKINPLIRQTLKKVNVISHEENSNFITGLINSLTNLGKIRNAFSHGKDLKSYKKEEIDNTTSLFLISTIENIACFIIDFYEIEHPLQGKEEIQPVYEDYQDFNEWLDEEYDPVEVAEVLVDTSIALFYGDKIAYLSKYQEFVPNNVES